MKVDERKAWLLETNPERLEQLWAMADEVRRQQVGDEVFLRGLIELSNICARQCTYCGIRAGNTKVERYRLTEAEVLACAEEAVRLGYGTVVMQAGEDYGIEAHWLAGILRRIKAETSLAITLSLGEREDWELELWREAGADRYLLRFETSNQALFERIHPPLGKRPTDRIAQLRRLRAIGFEIGSGVMVGIPGQTWDDLLNDLALFESLDLDMIGIGPFLPHPETPLGHAPTGLEAPDHLQVPNTELMTCKLVALTRLICPKANIPSTTALATLNQAMGRRTGLARGGNIVMPNLTPLEHRRKYEIYPAKACNYETPGHFHENLLTQLAAIGRTVGQGRGDSRRFLAASAEAHGSPEK